MSERYSSRIKGMPLIEVQQNGRISVSLWRSDRWGSKLEEIAHIEFRREKSKGKLIFCKAYICDYVPFDKEEIYVKWPIEDENFFYRRLSAKTTYSPDEIKSYIEKKLTDYCINNAPRINLLK
ncbi:MAG: hypothetical protein N3D84_02955 [Candidatus Woesearchaeota archaeon]|nr:hypothetical protein [Candidatus Woesearchaeota archaeon]